MALKHLVALWACLLVLASCRDGHFERRSEVVTDWDVKLLNGTSKPCDENPDCLQIRFSFQVLYQSKPVAFHSLSLNAGAHGWKHSVELKTDSEGVALWAFQIPWKPETRREENQILFEFQSNTFGSKNILLAWRWGEPELEIISFQASTELKSVLELGLSSEVRPVNLQILNSRFVKRENPSKTLQRVRWSVEIQLLDERTQFALEGRRFVWRLGRLGVQGRATTSRETPQTPGGRASLEIESDYAIFESERIFTDYLFLEFSDPFHPISTTIYFSMDPSREQPILPTAPSTGGLPVIENSRVVPESWNLMKSTQPQMEIDPELKLKWKYSDELQLHFSIQRFTSLGEQRLRPTGLQMDIQIQPRFEENSYCYENHRTTHRSVTLDDRPVSLVLDRYAAFPDCFQEDFDWIIHVRIPELPKLPSTTFSISSHGGLLQDVQPIVDADTNSPTPGQGFAHLSTTDLEQLAILARTPLQDLGSRQTILEGLWPKIVAQDLALKKFMEGRPKSLQLRSFRALKPKKISTFEIEKVDERIARSSRDQQYLKTEWNMTMEADFESCILFSLETLDRIRRSPYFRGEKRLTRSYCTELGSELRVVQDRYQQYTSDLVSPEGRRQWMVSGPWLQELRDEDLHYLLPELDMYESPELYEAGLLIEPEIMRLDL